MVDAVDYPNFKAVCDPQRGEVYETVWTTLRRLETLNQT